MASVHRKSSGDITSSVPFSYAQAAKGLASTNNSSSAASKAPSEPATPSKPLTAENLILADIPGKMNWADEAESVPSKQEAQDSTEEPAQQSDATESHAESEQPNGISQSDASISTATTLVKDDDTASSHNASTESTNWDNKSQTSQPVGRTGEHSENRARKGKKRDRDSPRPKKEEQEPKETVPAVPLQEAPIPTVNPWLKRAEEQKARRTSAPKPSGQSLPNGPPKEITPNSKTSSISNTTAAAKENALPSGRKDRNHSISTVSKSTAASQSQDKPQRHTSLQNDTPASGQPLPPVGDQESWPTPDTAQEKAEKIEKERPTSAPRSHGKNEWKPVDYTPSVIFNTPVPLLNARRGGRGGSRGGKEGNTRPSPSNTSASQDKENATMNGLPNGDLSKRDASSSKGKRSSSADAPSWRNAQASNGVVDRASNQNITESPDKDTYASQELNASLRQSSHNTFPRGHPSSKQRQSRKLDLSLSPEKRPAGDMSSPIKGSSEDQNLPSDEAGTSADVTADGQQTSRGFVTDRRGAPPFGSLSKAERNEGRSRGGMRGGRNGQGSQHAHTSSRSGRGGGPRSQSIATDQAYGRYYNSYGPPPNGLAPLQTYNMPNMYDQYPVPPMSAVPYRGFVDPNSLVDMVRMQLEYYFSFDNLIKDMFLRKHMDSQGYIFLQVIADFNRLKHLTTDMELIKHVCYNSPLIDYKVGKDGMARVRLMEGWDKWILPMGDRMPASQNDGPEELLPPQLPHPKIFEPYHMHYPMGPMTAGPDPGAHFPPFQAPNGVLLQHRASFANGIPGPQQARTPTGEVSNGSPLEHASHGLNTDRDDFNDSQIPGLTVVVRRQDIESRPVPPPFADSRTFSNGSLDPRAMFDPLTSTNTDNSHVNGFTPNHQSSADAVSESRALSPRSTGTEKPKGPMNVFWIKDKDAPVESLPAQALNEPYTELRSKALLQRQDAAPGSCPYDMVVLYQFWSHFLIRNFNTHMYDEFRQLAFEDDRDRASDNGLKNLLMFYDKALCNDRLNIRDRVARHYVALVKAEPTEHGRPAFKQLRAAWRNGALNMRNRKRITPYVDADLQAALDAVEQ